MSKCPVREGGGNKAGGPPFSHFVVFRVKLITVSTSAIIFVAAAVATSASTIAAAATTSFSARRFCRFLGFFVDNYTKFCCFAFGDRVFAYVEVIWVCDGDIVNCFTCNDMRIVTFVILWKGSDPQRSAFFVGGAVGNRRVFECDTRAFKRVFSMNFYNEGSGFGFVALLRNYCFYFGTFRYNSWTKCRLREVFCDYFFCRYFLTILRCVGFMYCNSMLVFRIFLLWWYGVGCLHGFSINGSAGWFPLVLYCCICVVWVYCCSAVGTFSITFGP